MNFSGTLLKLLGTPTKLFISSLPAALQSAMCCADRAANVSGDSSDDQDEPYLTATAACQQVSWSDLQQTSTIGG